MKRYNVVDSIWFNKIGIVRIRPEFGDDKFYIGVGEGVDKDDDEQYIATWGTPYRPKAIEAFFQ